MTTGAFQETGHFLAGARITVNAPHVIHEAIDGEVIIINLTTGNYYSLKGSAAEAWGLIQHPGGVDAAELVTAIVDGFGTSSPEVEAALEPFLAELQDEGLVTWMPASGDPVAAIVDHPRSNGPMVARLAFEPPTLEKFTDMQDLVLLDPVHEVDEMGWPQPRPDVAAGSSGS